MVEIDQQLCKGCGICIGFCPKQVLDFNDQHKSMVKNGDKCISCGLCELRCPDYAITVRTEEGK